MLLQLLFVYTCLQMITWWISRCVATNKQKFACCIVSYLWWWTSAALFQHWNTFLLSNKAHATHQAHDENAVSMETICCRCCEINQVAAVVLLFSSTSGHNDAQGCFAVNSYTKGVFLKPYYICLSSCCVSKSTRQ